MLRTGRFDVDVVSTPPAHAPADAWNAFRPNFAQYKVVLSNYNGEDWPEVVKALGEIKYDGWATAEVEAGGAEHLADIAARMDKILGTHS